MVHVQVLCRLLASRVVVETAFRAVAIDPDATASIVVMRPVGSIVEQFIEFGENLCRCDKARASRLGCSAGWALLIAVCQRLQFEARLAGFTDSLAAVTDSDPPAGLCLIATCNILRFASSTHRLSSIVGWKEWKKAPRNRLCKGLCSIMTAFNAERREKTEAALAAAAAGALAGASVERVAVAGGRHFVCLMVILS